MRCLPKRKQSETCKGGRKRTIHITSVLPFKLRILKRKDKGPKYHLCKSFDVSWSCISNNKVSIYFASLLEMREIIRVNVILDNMMTSCDSSVV